MNFKFTNILFLTLSVFSFSCKQTNKKIWKHYGYFGSAKYFDSNNVNSDYIENFIIKIDTGYITIYGTVQTWGRDFKYIFSTNKDTLLIEKQLKIYKKSDSSICFEYPFDDSLHREHFQFFSGLKHIVDSDGIISEKLGQFLTNIQLVGKYHYKNQLVEFKEDGTVVNFEKFKKYSVIPRLGTCTYYDNRIIETENGIWKFSKSRDNIMLRKYSTKRDKNDMFILSNDEVILKR